jgi:hypothetical protein
MATASQVEANRANAQLSTGPKTPAGLDAVRHNATRHGLTGKQIVVHGEDPAAYDALRARLLAEHAPASELEAMLVEELAQNFWRLERARRCESQMLQKIDLAAAMSDRGFLNLQRYTARIERSFNRAQKDLAALQAFRRKVEAKQDRAATAKSFFNYMKNRPPVKSEIGFVFAPAQETAPAVPPAGEKNAA